LLWLYKPNIDTRHFELPQLRFTARRNAGQMWRVCDGRVFVCRAALYILLPFAFFKSAKAILSDRSVPTAVTFVFGL